MRAKCMYYACMSVAIQIRDVPTDVRDALAGAASRKGQSMQAFLLDVLEREAGFSRNMEILDALEPLRRPIPPELSPETIIREGRDRGFEFERAGY